MKGNLSAYAYVARIKNLCALLEAVTERTEAVARDVDDTPRSKPMFRTKNSRVPTLNSLSKK